jgi:hypothetical protein
MNQLWFRPLVWIDYRLAILFTVIIPAILLIWSLFAKIESLQKLLIIYWRVASLLLITVYLMIASWPIGFVTSFLAKILIPISLWFWVDINDEIKDLPASPIKFVTTAWRWAVTIYSPLGAISTLPFLSCAMSGELLNSPYCQVWQEAPWQFREIFHSEATANVLGFFGLVGLSFYTLYFAHFLLIRLGKQGRSALQQ